MSTIDTSTWNPDADLNVEIEGIPLNSDASIAQTWQALRILMAAVKGDGDAIKAMISVMEGASATEDGASGLVPAPQAGDQNKVLQGDGTWGTVAAASHSHGNITSDGKLDTASRAVVTDSDKKIAVSSVTSTELGYLSGVTSNVQTQLDAKAADSGVVHLAGAETVTGDKTFTGEVTRSETGSTTEVFFTSERVASTNAWTLKTGIGGSGKGGFYDQTRGVYIMERAPSTGDIAVRAYSDSAPSGAKELALKADGTATWDGSALLCVSEMGAGYVRYSNGLQMCFETVEIKTGTSTSSLDSSGNVYYGTKTVTFPKAFSSAPVVTLGGHDGGTGFYNATTNSVSATQVEIEVYGRNSNVTCTPGYFAIGTWS